MPWVAGCMLLFVSLKGYFYICDCVAAIELSSLSADIGWCTFFV